MSKKLKVSFFSSSRADYGLFRPLLSICNEDPRIDAGIIVSGSHLIKSHGYTVKEIMNDKFFIQSKIKINIPFDSPSNINQALGSALSKYSIALEEIEPNIAVVLGDRFETFGFAQAAYILGINILHIHGGEVTNGSLDDGFRHSITKLSHLHCTSTERHKQRVIQLGENPKYVFNTGSLCVENFDKLNLLSSDDISSFLNFKNNNPYIVITYHPVTTGSEDPKQTISNILNGLLALKNYNFIFTLPNIDSGNLVIRNKIISFVKKYKNISRFYESLGSLKYLSLIRDAVIIAGNSSSAIIESPIVKTVSLDIGVRQKGRERSKSTVSCSSGISEIKHGLNRTIKLSKSKSDKIFYSPYYKKNTSNIIRDRIIKFGFQSLAEKKFYDR